jgi:hypothetical protein
MLDLIVVEVEIESAISAAELKLLDELGIVHYAEAVEHIEARFLLGVPDSELHDLQEGVLLAEAIIVQIGDL